MITTDENSGKGAYILGVHITEKELQEARLARDNDSRKSIMRDLFTDGRINEMGKRFAQAIREVGFGNPPSKDSLNTPMMRRYLPRFVRKAWGKDTDENRLEYLSGALQKPLYFTDQPDPPGSRESRDINLLQRVAKQSIGFEVKS